MASWHASGEAAPQEIPSLTPLRGVAALFVVAFHLRFYLPNLRYVETATRFSLWSAAAPSMRTGAPTA